MENKSLDDLIDSMREIGDVLLISNDKVPSKETTAVEDALSILRENVVTVDGYDLYVYYQKSDYNGYLVETLQIYNENSPFLPFNIVCKVGQKFLGSSELSLVELFKDNRKIYCWSVCVDKSGRPIPYPFKVKKEDCAFEGFKYAYMQSSQVNFF